MKYTKQERLNIGRRLYTGEMTRAEAQRLYDIDYGTCRRYMRYYRDENNLPPKKQHEVAETLTKFEETKIPTGIEDYESMTREELIRELVKTKVSEARLKKGYTVKGAGAEKEYILLDSENTR